MEFSLQYNSLYYTPRETMRAKRRPNLREIQWEAFQEEIAGKRPAPFAVIYRKKSRRKVPRTISRLPRIGVLGSFITKTVNMEYAGRSFHRTRFCPAVLSANRWSRLRPVGKPSWGYYQYSGAYGVTAASAQSAGEPDITDAVAEVVLKGRKYRETINCPVIACKLCALVTKKNRKPWKKWIDRALEGQRHGRTKT